MLPPLPPHQCPFRLMIYGFAHTFQREAWSLSDSVSAGFIGFDPPTTSAICTNLATLVCLCVHLCSWVILENRSHHSNKSNVIFSDWLQRRYFFSPLPLWPRSKGTDITRQAWKCPKWPLLDISINPWTSFAVSLVPLQIPCPLPCKSFPRCLKLIPLPLFRILC